MNTDINILNEQFEDFIDGLNISDDLTPICITKTSTSDYDLFLNRYLSLLYNIRIKFDLESDLNRLVMCCNGFYLDEYKPNIKDRDSEGYYQLPFFKRFNDSLIHSIIPFASIYIKNMNDIGFTTKTQYSLLNEKDRNILFQLSSDPYEIPNYRFSSGAQMKYLSSGLAQVIEPLNSNSN